MVVATEEVAKNLCCSASKLPLATSLILLPNKILEFIGWRRRRRCISSSPFLVRKFGTFWLSACFVRADLKEEDVEDDLCLLLLDLCLLLDWSLLEMHQEREVCKVYLLSHLQLLSGGLITTLGSDILLKSSSRGNKTLFELLLVNMPMAWVSLNLGWYKVWWLVTGGRLTGDRCLVNTDVIFSMSNDRWLDGRWPVTDWLENSCVMAIWQVAGLWCFLVHWANGQWLVDRWPVDQWPVDLYSSGYVPLELPPGWSSPGQQGHVGWWSHPIFLRLMNQTWLSAISSSS